jgi:DNA-binding MltR family transcriptional regulator
MIDGNDGIEVVRDIMAQYLSETDRSCAILICSHLDELMEKLLKARFVSTKSKSDDIFEGYGPLSSFSAKIEIAHRLGLVSKRMRSDLQIVRKVRNHMAHGTDSGSFESSPVKDWVLQVVNSVDIVKRIAVEDIIAASGGHYALLRIQYIIALSFFIADLLRLHRKCERIAEASEDTELYGLAERLGIMEKQTEEKG